MKILFLWIISALFTQVVILLLGSHQSFYNTFIITGISLILIKMDEKEQ